MMPSVTDAFSEPNGAGHPGPAGPPAVAKPAPQPSPSVAVSEGGLATASGTPIIKLSDFATVEPHEGGDGVVVGMVSGGPPAALLDAVVGELECSRFLALARAKLYWMLPVWSNPRGAGAPYPAGANAGDPAACPAADVPVETQFLLLELRGGAEYALLLPLIDKATGFRCSFRPCAASPHYSGSAASAAAAAAAAAAASPSGTSSMIVRMESGDEAVRASAVAHAFFCAAGGDPFELMERGVAAAAALSGTAVPRASKRPPAILDALGWCSWDAMYTDVNPRGLVQGLTALAAGGCPARWVVIDDGWQQTQLDAEHRAAGEGPDTGLAASLRALSLAEVRHRRSTADAVFQDLQVTAPLRAVERDKEKEEEAADAAAAATATAWWPRRWWAAASAAVGAPRRWTGAALGYLSSLRRRAEASAVRALQRALDSTSSDSSCMELFTAMATGPFREPLLRFYASASSHSRRLLSVRANGKFSSLEAGADAPLHSQSPCFGEVVAGLKAATGVTHVLCWHAMAGTWSGLMPGAPGVAPFEPEVLFPRPSPGTLEVDPSMRWVHPAVVGVGVPRRVEAFHSALHSYLRDCGVDGVKVDVQGTMAMFGWASGGYAAAAGRFHASLEASVAAHFPGTNAVLNSMCCDIESLYNLSHSALARVGEDFYPTIRASHTAHVAAAAFTSLHVGPLAFVDWDMMQSHHDAPGVAALHAAARAVSGGLVYVSDRPGEHDFWVLRRLALPDGGVLRARFHGRPTADCLFADVSRDRKTVLKIWNANAVTGVVAAFNVQGAAWDVKRRSYFAHDPSPPALTVAVRPSDVPGLASPTGAWAMYSDAERRVRVAAAAGEAWEKELRGGGGHDVLVISPMLELRGGVRAAPIGLVGMLNAGGAVLRAAPVAGGAGLALEVNGCGDFLVYASARPFKVVVGGHPAEFTFDEGQGAVAFVVPPPVHSGAGEVLVKF